MSTCPRAAQNLGKTRGKKRVSFAFPSLSSDGGERAKREEIFPDDSPFPPPCLSFPLIGGRKRGKRDGESQIRIQKFPGKKRCRGEGRRKTSFFLFISGKSGKGGFFHPGPSSYTKGDFGFHRCERRRRRKRRRPEETQMDGLIGGGGRRKGKERRRRLHGGGGKGKKRGRISFVRSFPRSKPISRKKRRKGKRSRI